jgi:epoxyqueuosine reductase
VRINSELVKQWAVECGFELAGVARAEPLREADYYLAWIAQGMAGEMSYLTDRRAHLRTDVRSLLPSARSVICVGKLYNGPEPYSTQFDPEELGWISRYAWGEDYHVVLRSGLKQLAGNLCAAAGRFEWKICVDTAPLLERAYAQRAGLGWIGKNTCLINQQMGSWFFLGELLVSLELEPALPPPDRCGSCTRCIDACPTEALVPTGFGERPPYALDSRRCISYVTIELRGSIPEDMRASVGKNVFGCDICQDVCPWNRKAPVTVEPVFSPRHFAPPLGRLAALSEQEFMEMFRQTPVARAKYQGFLRNVAVAMGRTGLEEFRAPLEKLAHAEDPTVSEHARWGLKQLK